MKCSRCGKPIETGEKYGSDYEDGTLVFYDGKWNRNIRKSHDECLPTWIKKVPQHITRIMP